MNMKSLKKLLGILVAVGTVAGIVRAVLPKR